MFRTSIVIFFFLVTTAHAEPPGELVDDPVHLQDYLLLPIKAKYSVGLFQSILNWNAWRMSKIFYSSFLWLVKSMDGTSTLA